MEGPRGNGLRKARYGPCNTLEPTHQQAEAPSAMNGPRTAQIRHPARRKLQTGTLLLVVSALAIQAGNTDVSAQVRLGIVERVVSDEYPVRQAALAEIRRMTPRW